MGNIFIKVRGCDMNSGYFHRVTHETQTRLWINNPTLAETEQAIAAGAMG
jgi:hypothetical protein